MRAVAVAVPPWRVHHLTLHTRAGAMGSGLAAIPPQRDAVYQAALLLHAVGAAVRVIAVPMGPRPRCMRSINRAAAAERLWQLLQRIVVLGVAW